MSLANDFYIDFLHVQAATKKSFPDPKLVQNTRREAEVGERNTRYYRGNRGQSISPLESLQMPEQPHLELRSSLLACQDKAAGGSDRL